MGKVVRRGGIILLLLLVASVLGGCGPQMVGGGWSPIAADASKVYAGLSTGKFVALDMQTGKQVENWEFPDPKSDQAKNMRLAGMYGEPVLTGNLVIFAASDAYGSTHTVYALDAATGAKKWAFPEVAGAPQTQRSLFEDLFSLLGGVWSSLTGARTEKAEVIAPKDSIIGAPAAYDGVVYVTSADRKLYAFNQETRELVWKEPFAVADGALWSGIAREGDRLFVGSMGHALYAVSARDGSRLWRFPQEGGEQIGAIAGTPAVDAGTVYVGDLTSKLYAINAADGTEKWRWEEARGWIWGTPAILDGKLYVGSLDHRVYALDIQTGKQTVWPSAYLTKGAVRAGPAVARGITVDGVARDVVYVASEDHRLYALDAATGASLWKNGQADKAFDAGTPLSTSPVVVKGVNFAAGSPAVRDVVFVSAANGKVFAVDAATGNLIWPEPTGK